MIKRTAEEFLAVWTNQRPVFRSRDQYWPIRGQYLLRRDRNNLEEVTDRGVRSVLSNQRPVFRSRDISRPIRGQYCQGRLHQVMTEGCVRLGERKEVSEFKIKHFLINSTKFKNWSTFDNNAKRTVKAKSWFHSILCFWIFLRQLKSQDVLAVAPKCFSVCQRLTLLIWWELLNLSSWWADAVFVGVWKMFFL